MRELRARPTRITLTIAAALFAVASAALIPGMLGKQHTADFFHADQPDAVHLTATVSDVSVAKAKNHESTSAEVGWDNGEEGDYLQLSDSDDASGQVPADHLMPVVVWHHRVVRFELGGTWHASDNDPDRIADDWRSMVAVFAAVAAVLGRFTTHWWLRRRVDHLRFLVGDLAVLPCAGATLIAAATGHATTLAYLAPLTLTVLAVSVFVLPAVPWISEPGRPRVAAPT